MMTADVNQDYSPVSAAELEALDKDVAAALAAYVQSGKGVDLSVLTQLPAVV